MKMILSLTGPSGAGKSTAEQKLVERGFAKLISVTTRAPRAGEVEGEHYYFITNDKMQALKKADQLVEFVEFGGATYGLTVAEVERAFASGKPVVVVVDPSGAEQIKRFCALKDWRHFAAYIDGRIETLVERFLNRMERDTVKNYSAASTRLINLIAKERHWVHLNLWNVVIEKFDEQVETRVLDFFCEQGRLSRRVEPVRVQ